MKQCCNLDKKSKLKIEEDINPASECMFFCQKNVILVESPVSLEFDTPF
jgi:hypothetical protein